MRKLIKRSAESNKQKRDSYGACFFFCAFADANATDSVAGRAELRGQQRLRQQMRGYDLKMRTGLFSPFLFYLFQLKHETARVAYKIS
jgi:hypothetical protein